jgi:hypothetical protein
VDLAAVLALLSRHRHEPRGVWRLFGCVLTLVLVHFFLGSRFVGFDLHRFFLRFVAKYKIQQANKPAA